MGEIFSYAFTWNWLKQFIKAIGVYNNKITNKAPPSGVLHQFTLTKRDRTKKEEITIWNQEVFYIDRTAKLCYDYVRIFRQRVVHKLDWQDG